jgi:putative ATP-grasp target RiPP
MSTESTEKARTEITDIPAAGAELDEGQLRLVSGGAKPTGATQTCAENFCIADR